MTIDIVQKSNLAGKRRAGLASSREIIENADNGGMSR